jgi:hypothetical protein
MAHEKSNQRGRTVTVPRTGRTGNKKSDQIDQESQADNRASIFVRISKDAKDVLDQAAKSPLTNASVVEALLLHYAKQNPEIQEKILDKESVYPLKAYDDVLALLHWAQHAFEHGRYILAAKLYKDIARNLRSSPGFRDFCNYKLGICWIRLSYDSRNEALKTGDYECYDLALEALTKALNYTKKVEGALGGVLSRLIKHYNLACCHSLKAQYMVEARLDKTDVIDSLLNAGHETPAMEEAWRDIGKSWRENYKGKGRNVDVEAQEALNELQEISTVSASEENLTDLNQMGSSDQLSERIWLAEAALRDDDLTFLRFDERKWQPELYKWSDSVLQGNKYSIADTIRALLQEDEKRSEMTMLYS